MNLYILPILGVLGFIAFKIHRRQKEGENETIASGCLGFGFIFLAYLIVSYLGIVFLIGTTKQLYTVATAKTYQAKVINIDNEIRENSEGLKIIIYTPTVKFNIENTSGAIIKKLDVSSTQPYQIGETQEIVYSSSSDSIVSVSIGSILLNIVGFLISLLPFSLIIYGFCYAFYITLPYTLTDLLIFFFGYIFLPIGMIGLNIGLIYYVYDSLIQDYRQEQPIWVLMLCTFFILILSFAKFMIVKMLIRGEDIFADIRKRGI